jgi:hypothetical protein
MAKPLKSIKFPDLPNRYLVAPPITASASGAIASFSDGADDLPVKDLTVSIAPKQAGSGTPSPSNVRAISGFTEATIKRAGKNILPFPYRDSSATSSGVTKTVNADGTISLSGTATAESTFIYTENLIDTIKPNVGDVLVFTDGLTYASNRYSRLLWANNLEGIGAVNGSRSLTVTQEHLTRGVYYGLRITSGANCNGLTVKPMVRVYGDAEYEPYAIQTYEVSFGSAGTVYGGTLDVTTGKLTVTHKKYTCTSVDEVGAVNNSRYAYSHTDKPSDMIARNYAKAYCDKYQNVTSAASRANGTFCINNGYILFVNDAFTSVSAANTLIASQEPEVVYPLATPIEVNLTPTEVRTLLGANNIWSDTGDATVTYRADTGLYIDKRIAEVQALVLD